MSSTSGAYKRMRAESPNEFEPKALILSPAIAANEKFCKLDWVESFRLRAAAVYSAVTETPVATETKSTASQFLINIAKKYQSIKESSAPAPPPPAAAAAPAAPASAVGQTRSANETITNEDLEHLSDELKQYADAIYLVVGFLPDLKRNIGNGNGNREAANKYYELAGSQEILTDIIKYENQLPLHLIYSVVEHVENAIRNTKEFYSEGSPIAKSIGTYKSTNNFYELLYNFCWYYSPFSYKLDKPRENFKAQIAKKRHLLECLHYSLMPHTSPGEEVGGAVCRAATAKQLKRSGVRFEPEKQEMIKVAFEEPVLRLPALVCDFKLETVARNLIAWEILNHEEQKPVMRYFQLLNDLVHDVRDVRVMKKAGVICGGAAKGRGWEELALVKKVARNASYPSVYRAVDQQLENVSKFYDNRMKSFLKRAHPAVFWVSSVAAASVIATAIYASRRRYG